MGYEEDKANYLRNKAKVDYDYIFKDDETLENMKYFISTKERISSSRNKRDNIKREERLLKDEIPEEESNTGRISNLRSKNNKDLPRAPIKGGHTGDEIKKDREDSNYEQKSSKITSSVRSRRKREKELPSSPMMSLKSTKARERNLIPTPIESPILKKLSPTTITIPMKSTIIEAKSGVSPRKRVMT
ncbi:unnamed protein product, partial [marine sediment metagenome]